MSRSYFVSQSFAVAVTISSALHGGIFVALSYYGDPEASATPPASLKGESSVRVTWRRDQFVRVEDFLRAMETKESADDHSPAVAVRRAAVQSLPPVPSAFAGKIPESLPQGDSVPRQLPPLRETPRSEMSSVLPLEPRRATAEWVPHQHNHEPNQRTHRVEAASDSAAATGRLLSGRFAATPRPPRDTASTSSSTAETEGHSAPAHDESHPASEAPRTAGLERGVTLVGKIAPRYPRSCRRRGHEGTGKLRVEVSPIGTVVSVRVFDFSGCDELSAAAVEAVQAVSFQPARRDGKPIASTIVLPIEFRLE